MIILYVGATCVARRFLQSKEGKFSYISCQALEKSQNNAAITKKDQEEKNIEKNYKPGTKS
jgi:hypothetical protein